MRTRCHGHGHRAKDIAHARDLAHYAQGHDLRVTDTQHTSVHLADGTNLPIQLRTTVLISADGSVEVNVDSATCGGQGPG
jgi:hypothetical protein